MPSNRPLASASRSADKRTAPRIWSEGRQQPRFDLRAFARVGLLLSRRMARPALLGTTRICANAAEAVAENTLGPRMARASRLAARVLPRRETVARGLTATGGLLTTAADLAEPPPPALPEPAGPPLLVARRPRQAALRLAEPDATPAPPQPAAQPAAQQEPQPEMQPDAGTGFDAPTLAAIRALIDEARAPAPPAPVAPRRPPPPPLPPPPTGRALLTQGVPLSPPEPAPPTVGDRLAAQAHRLAAGLLTAALTLVLLPAGLVRAGLIHLHGDDLRDWT